jgi:hypothetical protein
LEESLRGLPRALPMTLPAMKGRIGLLMPNPETRRETGPHAFRPAERNRNLDRPPTVKTAPTPQVSLYELDLLAAFRFLRDRKRPGIMILGVEPKIIDFGLELTAEVQTALPQLVGVSKQILAQWGLVPPAYHRTSRW